MDKNVDYYKRGFLYDFDLFKKTGKEIYLSCALNHLEHLKMFDCMTLYKKFKKEVDTVMLKQDIADRLQILFMRRIRQEQPGRELKAAEIENIWYTIYGKLCHGETEKEVEQWCKTVPIRKE